MHFVNVRGILSAGNGMNLYRGCTHGCIYCDSRSKCYHIEHDFEDIEVKQNAPELLEDALRRKRNKCMICTGAMCDPYMQCESKLGLTRRCLEIIEKYGFGASVQTKSPSVLRDLDLFKKINNNSKCVVQMTLTTFDEKLCKIIEPNVGSTKERFDTLMTLKENGIPTVVWLSPLLPFINDTEENLRGILDYCFTAGVKGIVFFGIGVTLREGDREYFYSMLDKSFPGLKQKYIAKYQNAYEVISDNSPALTALFKKLCKENNVMSEPEEIFKYLHTFEEDDRQIRMF